MAKSGSSKKSSENGSTNGVEEKKAREDFLIVGIGASAGGIQALKHFFENVPGDSGMAYVVILHLSPDHDSKLAEVLQIVSKIPVTQVKQKVHVEPNHVYVVPPNQHLIMQDGHINLSVNITLEERRAPVDIFFRTLAESHCDRAVCVVLSGTGANGSMGMKRIKECGGAAFVQNPLEAEFSEMARNSIATNLVDEVLPVAEIPAKIIAYKESLGTVSIPVEAAHRPEDQQQALREIFTQLRLRLGHDFSNYKRSTVLRRIERRISMRNLADLQEYAVFIKENPDEVTSLLKDLLISVTNFFRDKKPFEILERDIFPLIFHEKKSQDEIRIWVAGCATGEEAYSIAMFCAEKTLNVVDSPKIQIFATDIDATAINKAREGFYTLNDAADVSTERLRRFFNKEGDGYRIRREIRETILFAHHNFLKDPPFSHLDMVTCRNVLIYLNNTAQERVMETFHFALNPKGYLFLGTSESVEGSDDLFSLINREQHIYQSRQVAARTYSIPDLVPALLPEQFSAERMLNKTQNQAAERATYGDLHQRLLEQYAPPSVIINEEYDIVHISERAGRYLTIPGGELHRNLLNLIREELRLELRSALYQAIQRQTPVEARGLNLNIDGKVQIVNIQVRPVLKEGDAARGFILVIFDAVSARVNGKHIAPVSIEPAARQLEGELVSLKTQLRSSNEQYEFQAEELKAGNEELQAMNEELRSAAEELETSKEELQSINEELITVNQELKIKVEEVSISNNNLQNLINSTDIGTIFLDRSFRVMLFTPAAGSIFNLIAADFGRPLSDITHRLEYTHIIEDAETVLSKLQAVEREVFTTDKQVYVMRVLPYRTSEDHINGVVITFVNITGRKNAEEQVRQSGERFRGIISQATAGITETDLTGKFTLVNERFCKITGYTEDELLNGTRMQDITHPDDELHCMESFEHCTISGTPFEMEKRYVRKNGSAIWVSNSISALRDASGIIQNVLIVTLDITERRKAEDELRKSEERLRITMESVTDYAIITTDTQGFIEGWNGGSEHIFGYQAKEIIGQPVSIIFTPEDVAAGIHEEEMKTASGHGSATNERWHVRSNGTRFFMSGSLTPIVNNTLMGYVKIAQDMTERRQAEEMVRISEERYRIALQAAEMGTWDWNVAANTVAWNEQHYILLGLKPEDHQEKNAAYFLQFVHSEDLEHVNKKLTEAAEETGVYHAEFRIVRHNDGKVRWMSGYGRTVTKQNGHAVRMVGVIYDITERKELEQQKDEFIGIASHELKTPVTSIKVYAELLREMFERANDTQSAMLMGKLDAQVNRFTDLIGTLLDTTKISEGHLPLHPEKFDLNDLISEKKEDLQGISLKHRLTWLPDDPKWVTADKERIGQVLTNLISNAIKYSPNGGDVAISCVAKQDGVQVSVQDKGIGIPAEAQVKIFDRFYRVRNPQMQTFPGMGLGLYITAGIVRRHGGDIWVESNLGEGAIFSFTLPYISDAKSTE